MKDPKVAAFLLEQQLPPQPTVATSTLNPKSTKPKDEQSHVVVDHVTQVGLEACRCTHLQEYLPHILNSELCRTVDNRWIIADPIHSLHLASQLDDVQHANSWKQPPLLFGDEEQRTTVLKSQGIAEVWSPLDGYSASFQNDKKRRPESIPPPRLSGILSVPMPAMMPQTPTVSTSSVPYPQLVSGTTTPPPPLSSAAPLPVAPTGYTNTTATVPVLSGSAPPVTTGTAAPSVGNTSDNAGEESKPGETNAVSMKDDAGKMDIDTTAESTQHANGLPSTISSDPNATKGTTNGSVHIAQGTDPIVSMTAQTVVTGNAMTTSPKTATAATIEDKEHTSTPTPATTVVAGITYMEDTKTTAEVVVSADHETKENAKTSGSTENINVTDQVSEDTKMEVDDNGEKDDPIYVPTKGAEDTVAQESSSVEPKSGGDLTKSSTSDEPASNDSAPMPTAKATEGELVPVTSTELKQTEKSDASKPDDSKGDQAPAVKASSEPDSENLTSSPDPQSSNPVPSTSHPVEGASTAQSEQKSAVEVMIFDVPSAAAVAGAEGATVNPITSVPPFNSAAGPPAPSPPPQPHELADEHYHQLKLAENTVRMIRRSILTYGRVGNKKKSESAKKKRKKDNDFFKSTPVPGWIAPPPKEVSACHELQWKEARAEGPKTVERWMEQFRLCRESFYDEQRIMQKAASNENGKNSFYLSPDDPKDSIRCCSICAARTKKDASQAERKNKKTKRRTLRGDELMQCLECAFIGCGPKSTAPDSHQHILQHLLVSGHKFAITCGERAQIFCFCCGDFVYHKVFEQERLRLDYARYFTSLSWREHKLQRSFDPFQFIVTDDHGIVWRGPIATYPALVPKEHFSATQLTTRRTDIFEGRVQEKWLITKANATALTASQRLLDETQRFRIAAPVGMYNLGNTCFKSAILQCLIHCKPLQQFFLKEAGHHHKSCQLYRKKVAEKSEREDASSILGESSHKTEKIDPECLACEMDRLFLSYYGSTIGKDVFVALEESAHHLFGEKVCADYMDLNDPVEFEKGEPLIISELLTATWKSGGMNHLAGYEQRDAHEFLNSFLELMGKNTKQHRDRVVASIDTARDKNGTAVEKANENSDIVKRLFEGTLRSVFLCEECGEKRMLHEPFMNISLTLPEKVERVGSENGGPGSNGIPLSVETCLEHFIVPEKLGDPIECPHCEKRTPTKKQHTFAKLPKVLCLHLKRFDPARNRKIDEFVSFPAKGLNMGPLLSHWCEVSNVPKTYATNGACAEPTVLYDLFGTVNHIGNMQSGHYVTNVKVSNQWYHCNDAHIGVAGTDNGEMAVLNNEGAYILFYIRR